MKTDRKGKHQILLIQDILYKWHRMLLANLIISKMTDFQPTPAAQLTNENENR